MKLFWQNCPPNATFFLPEQTSVTLVTKLPEPPSKIPIQEVSYLPDLPLWRSMVAQTLQQKDLQKAVLARICQVDCKERIDPFAIASYLLKKAKNSTCICLETKNKAFVCSTPEILFRRKKKTITSDILAGTMPLGDAEEKILLNDPKLRKEWDAVRFFLEEQFLNICDGTPTISQLQVRKTSHVQHLYATIEGTLKEGLDDLTIAKILHPTPAVCGLPREKAQQWIAKAEPFSRGLYASALGYSTKEEALFVVAIRACQIEDTQLSLYTGAGILRGSDADKEWSELNHKMALYTDLLEGFV
jgi:menaquinone-specific isochorismate synthase